MVLCLVQKKSWDFSILTIHKLMGDRLQKLKCLLPNDVSLANLNLSGSTNTNSSTTPIN